MCCQPFVVGWPQLAPLDVRSALRECVAAAGARAERKEDEQSEESKVLNE